MDIEEESEIRRKDKKKAKTVKLPDDLIVEESDQEWDEGDIQVEPVERNSQKQVKEVKGDRKERVKIKERKKVLGKIGVPGITIARAQRPKHKPMTTAGPFDYQAKKLESKPGCTFPKSPGHQSKTNKKSDRVGPGLYHSTKEGESPRNHYTIGWKYESIFQVKKNIPGPGQYQNALPQLATSKSKSISVNKGFGTSTRFSPEGKSPGPGDYENARKQRESINKKRTLSSVGRQSPTKEEPIPGPGSYNHASYFDNSLKLKKGASIGLRTNNRASLPDLTSESYNKYSIVRDFDRLNAPAYTIGQQKRKFVELDFRTPGPLDYDNVKPYVHSPSARIGQADDAKAREKMKVPGPGTYQGNLNDSSVRYSFTKSKSISTVKTSTELPGVGRYNISVQESKVVKKGPTFGKEKKIKDQEKATAGVGDYNIELSAMERKGITIPKAGSPK